MSRYYTSIQQHVFGTECIVLKTAPLAFPIISPSLHAPLGLGLRGEQERERRYKSKPIHMYICL